MNRRKLTLLALLLVASMASAPAHAQTSGNEYLLAHLCNSYAAGQNAEIPRVLQLRAAVQRAEEARRTATPVSNFWAASSASIDRLIFAATDLSRVDLPQIALRDLRGTVQAHAPPALS